MPKPPTDKWFSMRTDFFGSDAYHLGLFELSGRAIALYVASIAYACRWGIDHCYRYTARQVFDRPGPVIDELVKTGFWVPSPAGDKFFVSHEGILWRRGTPLQRRAIPLQVRAFVMQRDGYACSECESPDELTLDHIWPYSRGGTDEPSNLRVLCRSCNSTKGARVDGS